MWELVSLSLSTTKKKVAWTDGNALSTGEYPFETGQRKIRIQNSILHKNILHQFEIVFFFFLFIMYLLNSALLCRNRSSLYLAYTYPPASAFQLVCRDNNIYICSILPFSEFRIYDFSIYSLDYFTFSSDVSLVFQADKLRAFSLRSF